MADIKIKNTSLNNSKKRSISRILTTILTLTIVIVTVITVSLTYLFISLRARSQLEEKVQETLDSLTAVLEMPVWNEDQLSIKRIARAYAHNELVEKINITDNLGDEYFDFYRKSNAATVSRSGKILHNGQTIGLIEISLTEKSYAEMNRRLLLSGLTTLIAVVLVIVFVTGYLSRRLLSSLMNRLNGIVNEYASGRFEAPGHDMPFLEFQPLVDVLGEMGSRIDYQIKELRNAEEKYRLLIENQTDMIVKFDTKGCLLFVSPSYCKMFNKTQEELLGKEFMPLIHPEDYDAVAKAIDKVSDPPYTGYVEERAMTKDGWRWQAWLNTALRNKEGIVESIIAVGRDINEQKQAEESLRESESRLKTILDSIKAGIIIIDVDTHQIVDINPAAIEIIGTSREQVIGSICNQCICTEENGACPITDLGKKIDNSECILLKATGEKVPIIKTATNISIKGKDYLLESFIDITEKKKLEVRLQQTQKMEAIGTLAGGIAHDFNNILGAIVGYSDIALDKVTEEDQIYYYLKQILQAGHRATDLVKQILTFSRQSDQEQKPVKIGLIIKEVVKLLRASLPTTIEIQTDISVKSDLVLADATQIHQVLMNLCTNAGHAMHEKGGILHIRLSEIVLDPQAIVSYPDLCQGSYLRLLVSDTGHGMTPDVMERIFDPFFTTKKLGEGTGMGLAVVHGIVKDHRGIIRVSSKPGKGTTFDLFLPLHEAVSEQELETISAIPRGNERILFVDDEATLVDLGQAMLQRFGYEVVTRTSSLEALEEFRSKPDSFDLVITDLTMPNMTGDALAKELLRIRPDIPIIICTGFSERLNSKEAEAIGISEYLFKPLITRNLAESVRRALET